MTADRQTIPVETETAADESAIKTATVGVFDSGVGGFTVAGAILSLRPDINLVYYGDSINVPYGGRTPEQLSRFAANSIEFLKSRGMDVLAVGCNASNSVLGQGDLHSFGVMVYDLVGSTISVLSETDEPPQKVALVATEASINSGYWQRKLQEAFPAMDILPIAAPEFVPLIESDELDNARIRAAVSKVLRPCLEREFFTILHGCTHYPLIQDYMAELSASFSFIDPATCLASRLVIQLPPASADTPSGSRRFFSSLPGPVFFGTARKALGLDIESMTKMYIVNAFED